MRAVRVLLLVAAVVAGVLFFHRGRLTPEPAPSARPSVAGGACRETYRRAFAEPSFEARVVFGYKDARPARFVADRYERMLFIERLLGECGPAGGLCGFRRDTRNVDLFTKEISRPDGGAPREFRIRVIASSVGPDDEENRKDPAQSRRSQAAERAFLEGLDDADIVIYNGHSRAGGGPDFRPPRLKGGHVDYGWYKANTPGLRLVLDRLSKKKKDSRLKMLGFLSCASTRLFLGKVGAERPGLPTLSSPKLLYFSDAFAASVEVLTSIITERCEPEFSAAMANAETRAGGARVDGWFRKGAGGTRD